jgi:DNA-binding CsgD family transcriptional regulator
MLPATPFVGREDELALLDVTLDRTLDNRGQVVLLVGEPGIGKTRTTERFAMHAQERGVRVLWGSCYEWEGAPAYWPWTQALRAWFQHAGTTDMASLPPVDLALLSRVVPELAERRIDLSQVVTTASEESAAQHFQLLMAAGSLVRRIAADRPVLIVLDDVHWSDTPSLRLLHFLAQEIRAAPVLLVATCRTVDLGRQHPLTTILADLARERNFQRLTLRGWPKAHLEQFVTLVTGRAQAQELVDALHEETNGNPLFAGEVTRLLAAEGQLAGTPATARRRTRVPDGVRAAVRRRLDHLSLTCNETLAAASIAGRDFDVGLLERATGIPAVRLLADLDEAVAAQLLLPGPHPGTFRFSHALVQETVYHEQPSARRAQGHLAIGQALEAAGAGQVVPWSLLAYHAVLAAPLSDPAKTCAFATRAGEAALLQFDWDVAADHFRQALAALDAAGPDDDAERCRLLIALGEALNRAGDGSGDVPEARAHLVRAFSLAERLGDAEQMARAAVGYAGVNIVATFGGVQQLQYLEKALAALGPADTPLRVRVLSRMAVDLWKLIPADRRRPREVATEAVQIALRLGATPPIAIALWARFFASMSRLYLEERVADADLLVAHAERTDDPLVTAWGYLARMIVEIERGHMAEAQEMLAAVRSYGERGHMPYLALRAAAYQAALDIASGRYEDAERNIARADALWQSAEPSQFQCHQFLLCRDLGRPAGYPSDIQVPNHLHLWRFAAQAQRMALALERGQLDLARTDYEALLATGIISTPYDVEWYGVVARLAEAAVSFGDQPRVAVMRSWLAPFADRIMWGGSLGVCYGPAAWYLGHLAVAQGDWHDAWDYFTQALALSERNGLRPFVARSLVGLAAVAARRNPPGDRASGYAHLERAIALAESIGMDGLLPEAQRVRAALASSPMSPVERAGVSPRELEVLRLVSEGLSDAEIAERLFLSRRTVNSHLTSLYAKLGVSSRTAAAHWAVAHDVV